MLGRGTQSLEKYSFSRRSKLAFFGFTIIETWNITYRWLKSWTAFIILINLLFVEWDVIDSSFNVLLDDSTVLAHYNWLVCKLSTSIHHFTLHSLDVWFNLLILGGGLFYQWLDHFVIIEIFAIIRWNFFALLLSPVLFSFQEVLNFVLNCMIFVFEKWLHWDQRRLTVFVMGSA